MKLGLPFGISTGFWFLIGLVRVYEDSKRHPKRKYAKATNVAAKDIAVVVPAHNEEPVIRDCIQALKQSFLPTQIYVASDGSHDATAKLARREQCQVLEINPGVGKAKALIKLIDQYKLYERYKFIFILDADTKIDKYFLSRALPYLEDPKVGVVFASARIHWPYHIVPRLRYYFMAYRERLNRALQYFLIYGQTWKYTNVNFVIPGFCTIYKSSVLRELEIDTPGLLIEDFNLGFQFHKKKMGTMGYDPAIIGWDQHPDNLADYWKQVRRWNIGFFQTVKINGIWPSFFWLSLGVFTLEVFLHSFFILLLPFVLLGLLSPILSHWIPAFHSFSAFYQSIQPIRSISLGSIFIGFFLFDYITTVVIGFMTRKPQFIIYGLFFFFLHYVTSLILLSSLIPGFFSKSEGRWVSPKRHEG